MNGWKTLYLKLSGCQSPPVSCVRELWAWWPGPRGCGNKAAGGTRKASTPCCACNGLFLQYEKECNPVICNDQGALCSVRHTRLRTQTLYILIYKWKPKHWSPVDNRAVAITQSLEWELAGEAWRERSKWEQGCSWSEDRFWWSSSMMGSYNWWQPIGSSK